MKTEFEARPAYVRRKDRIKAHFLTCYISLLVYRLLEKKLGNKYTSEQILHTLRCFYKCQRRDIICILSRLRNQRVILSYFYLTY